MDQTWPEGKDVTEIDTWRDVREHDQIFVEADEGIFVLTIEAISSQKTYAIAQCPDGNLKPVGLHRESKITVGANYAFVLPANNLMIRHIKRIRVVPSGMPQAPSVCAE